MGTVNIVQNGIVNVTNYASANVNVPNSYSASDEGKVVANGALASQTTQSITTNGTYDTTTINEVTVNVSGGSSEITTKYMATVELSGVSTSSISIPIPDYQLTGNEKFMATGRLVGTGTYADGEKTWGETIQVPSDVTNSNRLIVSAFYSNRRLGISTINNSSGTAVSGSKLCLSNVYAINTTAAGGAVNTNGNTSSIDTENNAIVLKSNTGYKYCNTTWATRYEFEVYLLTSSGTLA